MSTKQPNSIRNGLLILGICASLAAGSLGFATSAEARVSGPRVTSIERRCGILQDEFDKWWDRYIAAPAGSPGETKAFQMMGNMESAWSDIGCDDAFGSIGFKPIPLKQHIAPGVALR